MSSRYQLSRDEDDGLTCRLCLQAFWMKEELNKHLTDVHSFTEKDQEEEKRRNVQRVMEQRRRIALAQQQRMQSAMVAGGRGGGIMRGRGGISVSPGMTRPKFSFQYHDGGFICELCKKKFSDGNDMVKHWRTHNTSRGRVSTSTAGRGRGRGRPPLAEGSSRGIGRGRGRGRGRQKSEKTLRREERLRKKEEKAKRKTNSKRPSWTPYLMWSTRRRKKLMVKHPEWNFGDVSKAISEGWKEVTMEEVERLEEEVFCLNERSKFKAKGKAYWTAFKLWSKRMRKEILEEHPAWTDYAVESALERKWKSVKKEEIDVLEDQVTLLSENNDEKVEKGFGNFNAFLCWSINKMKNIQTNIPNWSDIQIGKSITDGWLEIEKEEIEGLDFEAFCLNEKVNKRVQKKGKRQRKSMDADEDEGDEEIGDDEEWDPYLLKLKQLAKFIDKLETMEELQEQPAESTEEEKEDQKDGEHEKSEVIKDKKDENEDFENQESISNTSHTNVNEQHIPNNTDHNNANEDESNLEIRESKNQQLKDDQNQSCEETKEENGEIINQMNQEQDAINCEGMILEQPTQNNDISMETSETEDLRTKDPMIKDSPPSLTQSTLDNDALEDLFEDKSIDTVTEDAIVKELPL